MTRARRFAWKAMVVSDAGLLAWGAMAALAPGHLLGPDSTPILAAGYEGYTGTSWQELVAASPAAAGFMEVVFRVYGAYIVAFGVLALAIAATAFRDGRAWAWWALLAGNSIAYISAMAYDWTVGAIGPFEITEYVGLGLVYGALAVTAPFAVLSASDAGRRYPSQTAAPRA